VDETLRIAVVQAHDAPPDTTANLRAGLVDVAAAADAGAGLVVFPELFLGGYYLDHAMARRAAEASAALDRLQAAVDETGVAAVLGAALLGARGSARRTPGRPAVPAVDPLAAPLPSGDVLLNAAAVLRPHQDPDYAVKAHLYPGEDEWFTPGHGLWTGRIAGWPCGIAVCYELGFPEVARSLALQGARLILLPAAFGRARAHIWDVLTRARAIENGCYLAAAGQAGTAGGRRFLGCSRIVDPYGEVIAGCDGAGRSGHHATADARGDDPDAPPSACPTVGETLRVGPHLVHLADLSADRVAAARRGDHGWHRTLTDRRPGLYDDLTREPPSAPR
jgi:predicted amidohydrolase